jgi:sec-independent protein translocase protein TatB
VFNFSGSEIVFLLLLALIILGPEKLPDAIRSFGKTYAEFKKMTTGFQSELKNALDEPMREMRETADAFKQAASFDIAADMLEGKMPVAAPTTENDTGGAAPPIAAPPPKEVWTAHEQVGAAPAPGPEPSAVTADPDLSMLDSVVMDRDHTYQPPSPAEAPSAGVGEVDNGEADAS